MILLADAPARVTTAVRTLPGRREALLVTGLVALSSVLHAWNMFRYPYLENDEATYTSRGWVFITEGHLDVNTYRYDHAPMGWMIIGSWLGITGGGDVFGGLLETARVFMLVVQVANTLLIYRVATRLAEGRTSAGAIAAVVFAMSPLGIYFHRRVLLDNVMVLLILIALVLLLRRPLTLGATVGSGLAFGAAVLTKLNAAFFGLGFLVLIWFHAVGAQRKHALVNWFASAGGAVLMFFVYAMLNSELLPARIGADGVPEHVSLIDTFRLQLGRGDAAWPWQAESAFRATLDSWLAKDALTLVLGAVAVVALAALLIARRHRSAHIVALLACIGGYTVFLVRGGIVINLYITPLLPFLAIAIGIAVAYLIALLRRGTWRHAATIASAVALAVGYVAVGLPAVLTVDETRNQYAALEWIEREVDQRAIIVGDNYVYPALAQDGSHAGVMYFFPAEYDPELRDLYGDDWRNIDYLVLTHEVVEQISQGTVPHMAQLLEHSDLVASFTTDSTSFIDLDQRISTNGDWAQVWATKSRNQIVLQDAWDGFRENWLVSYGQVLEQQPGSTTSLDQALAMQQALDQDDEATFIGVWNWTTDHLRHRTDDGLTSWLWLADDLGEGELGSPDTVCAADQEFISLLLKGADAWGTSGLRAEAQRMAADWWRECTFSVNGLRLVDSSADGSVDDRLVNPSYFNPVLYRQFASELPGFEWERLIDDGYTFLEYLMEERGTIPDWVVITEEGELASAIPLTGADADRLGDDTLHLVPTLLREQLAGQERAIALLDALEPLLISHAEAVPSLPARSTVSMLAQVRDIGEDPIRLYRDVIAVWADPDTGRWDVTLHDFTWLHSWHAFQEDLPATMTVPLL